MTALLNILVAWLALSILVALGVGAFIHEGER
jgi:hypothetical protein